MTTLSGHNWELHVGDSREVLPSLPAESVHCCVTSPPYYGLRAYGTQPQIWGGDENCRHAWGNEIPGSNRGGSGTPTNKNHRGEQYARGEPKGCFCQRCGAWEGELGSEPTVGLFVEHLVEVFREVKQVLHPTGTLWLNIGDSYASGKGSCFNPGGGEHSMVGYRDRKAQSAYPLDRGNVSGLREQGLKPKDLIGVPWMLAFALRADGWYLRSEIIWHKRSPMPESVRDRPTRAHEQIFLLSKADRYFFDSLAVQEPTTGNAHSRGNGVNPKAASIEPGDHRNRPKQNASFSAAVTDLVSARNRRTVWALSHEPYAGAHFAVFPSELPAICIKAGTSEKGCCPQCGAPWVRMIESDRQPTRPALQSKTYIEPPVHADSPVRTHAGDVCGNRDPGRHCTVTRTVGWEPGCSCNAGESAPAVVLDPFAGSGTTLRVAVELGRRAIGIELNAEYADLARKRITEKRDVTKQVTSAPGQKQMEFD